MRVRRKNKRSRVTIKSASAAQTIEQLALAAEKRSLRNAVDEEDETLTEWELCRKYSKTGSMEQD
tara:strand:+ start:184 stop:378 length:195 start_codon:yes stop_codon:yes gene_type:complete